MNLSKESLSRARVLVVGDVMLDRYWYGEVDRTSPEAPVPIVRITREEERRGGAANVAYNVVTLGAKSSLLTVVGDDEASDKLESLVLSTGISAHFGRDPDLKTTVKLRVIGRQQQLLRLDFENTPRNEVLASQSAVFASLLPDHHAVLFSDYGKGGLTHIADMITRARSAGKPILIDPKGSDYSRYKNASVITPNRAELRQVIGAWLDESELQTKCQNLRRQLGLDAVLLTRSEEGMYFVINDVSLHRVADGAEVPVFSLSLSLDAASWTWGFEASLPASAETMLDPGNGMGPVALMAHVNGADFHVLAESISRERTFGDASIKITGRGRNAVLAAPYAPVMTFSNAEARTARQLMDDVLTINGISLGWSIDWRLTDWNVPAGVFAQQGTWIEALTAIASAAGGYLIPHRTNQSIRVRRRYPVPPWEWDTVTPDFVLPVAAVQRESLRWLEKPAYNRVFVSGQEVGVLGQVTRAWTAGDVLAPSP